LAAVEPVPSALDVRRRRRLRRRSDHEGGRRRHQEGDQGTRFGTGGHLEQRSLTWSIIAGERQKSTISSHSSSRWGLTVDEIRVCRSLR
jgi:hypothetical protein